MRGGGARELEKRGEKDVLGNGGLCGAKELDHLQSVPAASEIVSCQSECRPTSKTDIVCPYYLLKILSPLTFSHFLSSNPFLFFFAPPCLCVPHPVYLPYSSNDSSIQLFLCICFLLIKGNLDLLIKTQQLNQW